MYGGGWEGIGSCACVLFSRHCFLLCARAACFFRHGQLGVPWPAIAIVATVSALLSAVAPAARLTRAGITKLLRSFGG